ncbi:uroporphyrinogen-III C-methyltransferase [Aquabacterium sp.]|uniref:uroporphyrinogen-III C-methyltransferase n=1 Tax=Aquabacterium sp. TaxID=1872578 RepID=UPI0025C30E27|nr:uroporphyrinogen-III C-methyltransferase [Aquabacterium sp.]
MTEPTHPTPETLPARVVPQIEQDLTPSPAPADWVRWAVLVLSLTSAGGLWLAWQAQSRVQGLEQELVRRQQASQTQATEAHLMARSAQELSRESAARTALLETRLAEVALQRTQVEDLIKNLSTSRDENLLADIEASLRVATQQASLTGSAEPLVVALQSAEARLTRAAQPRLDNIRRAVAKDLDQVRATRVADLNALTVRLDEATRLVDEVPLLNSPEAARRPPRPTKPPAPSNVAATPEPVAPADNWRARAYAWLGQTGQSIWHETRNLIRVTQINRPEGMLISPEQSFFLRENIKLRLLNARLALLSRQTTIAVSDLQEVEASLPRYFDTQSRKTQLLRTMLLDVAQQSTQTAMPRPDDTLAALATVSAGR